MLTYIAWRELNSSRIEHLRDAGGRVLEYRSVAEATHAARQRWPAEPKIGISAIGPEREFLDALAVPVPGELFAR